LVVLALCYRMNKKVEGENEMPCLNLETKTTELVLCQKMLREKWSMWTRRLNAKFENPTAKTLKTVTVCMHIDIRAYSKSTLNEWRFNLSFSRVSLMFLKSWRASVIPYYVTTHPPATLSSAEAYMKILVRKKWARKEWWEELNKGSLCELMHQ
jgi:ribosomal protein S10